MKLNWHIGYQALIFHKRSCHQKRIFEQDQLDPACIKLIHLLYDD